MTEHVQCAAPKDTGAAAWEAIYQANDAGWDLGEANPVLVHVLAEKKLPAPPRHVLVPGCGTGHDALAFLDAGYAVTAMDFAQTAVATAAARSQSPFWHCLQADALAADNGVADNSIDIIFEHTFFCALQPHQREAYAASLARMIKAHGELWALSMRTKFTNRQPYDSTPEEYIALMTAQGFHCVEQEPMEAWSHQRRKGRETLVRLRYEG